MPSLRHVIDARETHIEMHDLLQSMKDHAEVPSTFDGQIPEYAFNDGLSRIMVGSRYRVKDHEGVERLAKVTAATVSEHERIAICGVTFEEGRSGIWTVPLSDEELTAWRRHPDTFFGVLSQRSTRAETPLELYDFLHESFKRMSKDDLLNAIADAPDFATLAQMDQSQLASIYAERMTYGALAMQAAAPSGIDSQGKE